MSPTAAPSARSTSSTNTTNRTTNIPCATWLAAPMAMAGPRRGVRTIVRSPSSQSATRCGRSGRGRSGRGSLVSCLADRAAAGTRIAGDEQRRRRRTWPRRRPRSRRAPAAATARPPSGDPTSRAMLDPTAFIAFAEASSSRRHQGRDRAPRSPGCRSARGRTGRPRRGTRSTAGPPSPPRAAGSRRTRLEEARRDQDPAPVPAVHEHAAELPDDERRDELGHEHRRCRERGPGELEHEHRQPDEQHPVAEVADERRPPTGARTDGGGAATGRPWARRRPSRVPRQPGTPGTRRGPGAASAGASSRVRPMYGRSRASTPATRAASSAGETRSP